MLTANRLLDGEVVYWQGGGWQPDFARAEIFTEADQAAKALDAAQAFVRDNKVVGTYLFEVREETDGVTPVKEREIIRSLGPSVRRDMGKQALMPAPPAAARPVHETSPPCLPPYPEEPDVSI
jgi:hypothetical protein